MQGADDGDALRRMLAVLGLLDTGWRPGTAELESARYVEGWMILPPKKDAPFQIIGSSWTLPIRYSLMVAGIFAIDTEAHWARTFDEWVVIGDAADAAPFNADEIRRVGTEWLWNALQRLPASA